MSKELQNLQGAPQTKIKDRGYPENRNLVCTSPERSLFLHDDQASGPHTIPGCNRMSCDGGVIERGSTWLRAHDSIVPVAPARREIRETRLDIARMHSSLFPRSLLHSDTDILLGLRNHRSRETSSGPLLPSGRFRPFALRDHRSPPR